MKEQPKDYAPGDDMFLEDLDDENPWRLRAIAAGAALAAYLGGFLIAWGLGWW